MKKTSLLLLVVFIFPLAHAHQHDTFTINGKHYEFTVGSLNEPVYVGDKTGVDLRVKIVTDNATIPLIGLEKTLKVELQANGATKTLEFKPVWNNPGAYAAYFYPSQDARYAYRIYGTIDGAPFDHSFICNPKGHVMTQHTGHETKELNDSSHQLSSGSFGCPLAKEGVTFPPITLHHSTHHEMQHTDWNILGLGIGILASLLIIIVSLIAFWKRI